MQTTSDSSRSPAKLLSIVFAALLATTSLVVLPGCGGGDTDKEGSASSDDDSAKLDASREKAVAAKADAKAVEAEKYAASDWNTAEGHFEKGDDKESYKYFDRAAKAYKSATKNAKKNADSLKEVFAMKDEYQKLRAEAEKSGAEKLMPDTWKLAEKGYANAVSRLDDGKRSAKTLMRQAKNDMELIVTECSKKLKDKGRAAEARELAVAGEKAALAAGAEQHAAVDLDFARNSLRDATHRFDDGNYASAMRLFDRAKSNFAFAAENANLSKQGMAAKARPPEEPDTGDGDTLAGGSSSGDGGSGEGGIGEPTIPKPDSGSDSGDVDMGDILANLDKLFTVSAEQSGDLIKLEYDQDGDSFSKDVTILYGKPGTNVVFKGKEHTATDEYTFAGNEKGMILLNGSFTEKARLFADIQFQLWGAESTRYLELLMFWDPKTDSGYALRIGNNGLVALSYKDNNPRNPVPSVNRAHRPDVNKWMNRRETNQFELRIEPIDSTRSGDDVKRAMTVLFNGEEIIKMKANSRKKGFFGFRWKDAKFYAKSVSFTGMLDKEWATKVLKGSGGGEHDGGSGGDLDF